MKRVMILTVSVLAASVGGCVLTSDPCADETCSSDRICAVLQGQPTCLCADPAIEIDGKCVIDEEAAEGEGEGE